MTHEEKIMKLRTARNTLHKLEHGGILENNLSMEQITAIRIAEFALDELCKSEDIQPVKHGRWIEHHAIWIDQPEIEGWFVEAKCSECERCANAMNPYTKSVDYERCPHCAVKMDGNIEEKVNEPSTEVSRPDGNCLDCKFQFLENSDYWCSICPGNPEDI